MYKKFISIYSRDNPPSIDSIQKFEMTSQQGPLTKNNSLYKLRLKSCMIPCTFNSSLELEIYIRNGLRRFTLKALFNDIRRYLPENNYLELPSAINFNSNVTLPSPNSSTAYKLRNRRKINPLTLYFAHQNPLIDLTKIDQNPGKLSVIYPLVEQNNDLTQYLVAGLGYNRNELYLLFLMDIIPLTSDEYFIGNVAVEFSFTLLHITPAATINSFEDLFQYIIPGGIPHIFDSIDVKVVKGAKELGEPIYFNDFYSNAWVDVDNYTTTNDIFTLTYINTKPINFVITPICYVILNNMAYNKTFTNKNTYLSCLKILNLGRTKWGEYFSYENSDETDCVFITFNELKNLEINLYDEEMNLIEFNNDYHILLELETCSF